MQNTNNPRARVKGQYLKEQELESYIFGWPQFVTVYEER